MVSKKKNEKNINIHINNSNNNTNKNYNHSGPNFKLYGILLVVAIILIVGFLIVRSTSKVELGDIVSVNYIGKLQDGSVFDTNIEEVGRQAGLAKESYQPFTFLVGNGDVIPGFENNVIGMKKGEKKTFVIEAKDAYGEVRENLFAKDLNRTLVLQRYSEMSNDQFKSLFNKEPSKNEILVTQLVPWSVKVVEVNETFVKLENLLNVGQNVQVSGVSWNSTVSEVTNVSIIIRQNPRIGDTVSFPTDNGFLKGTVYVVNENSFDVNANHPLAGQTLTFEVTVEDIEKKEN